MTIENLKELKQKHPFEKFTIHMSDGKSFNVDDPEDLVIRRDWKVDVLVLQPRGRFSFVYLKNVTHITGEGKLPRFKGRRTRGDDQE
ncbi:MAG TPA: hypothetical protein VLI90_16585 [Tepidisphaeraceae bacterium]|nr:hypothetical protein [Tepidisphaeraceae bacterium]